ncbi:MAG: hypothetical protein Q8M15_04120 [Bacteroidota bacterium]|nr:hypothetical protein [Bacteroidota bacterium]
MTRLTISIILILVTTSIYSQVDSLEKQILNYEDSKSTIISKGRNLLLDRFIENDINKVKEIKNYLIKKGDDKNYFAFYPVEYWFILYWTNEYEELANNIKAFDSIKVASYNERIKPPDDKLYERLKIKSQENAAKIMNQIQIADINAESKKFLLLNFEYLTSDMQKSEFSQDTLNSKADKYLEEYSTGEYKDFTKKHIRYKLVHKDWGMAFEFFSGYSFYTGILSDNYTNNVPFGVAFDICYKKFELYLRDYIGFNKTKKDIYYSLGIWGKGSKSMVYLPEASIGYVTLNNNRVKISPFAGIGAMCISPPSKDTEKTPELKEVSLEFTTTYMIGVNFDVKFGQKTPSYRPKSSYGFIRVRYAYNIPGFDKKYNGISGNMHYITIGFGGLARELKREY